MSGCTLRERMEIKMKSLDYDAFVLLSRSNYELDELIDNISDGWGPKGKETAAKLLKPQEIKNQNDYDKIKSSYAMNVDEEGNVYDILLPIPIIFGGKHSSHISHMVNEESKKKYFRNLDDYTFISGVGIDGLQYAYHLMYSNLIQYLRKHINRKYALLRFDRAF